MRTRLRNHFKRHYATYILVTNTMVAVATGAFAILGVLSDMLTVPVLLSNAVVFGLIMLIGKLGNEQLEDIEKIELVEQECSEGKCE